MACKFSENVLTRFFVVFSVVFFFNKRGKFITRKLTKEESFPNAVNRAVQVHRVKHFNPHHCRVQLPTSFKLMDYIKKQTLQ